ncbi:MAG: hypothetical protein ACK559_30325, partial [bacterium]
VLDRAERADRRAVRGQRGQREVRRVGRREDVLDGVRADRRVFKPHHDPGEAPAVSVDPERPLVEGDVGEPHDLDPVVPGHLTEEVEARDHRHGVGPAREHAPIGVLS